MNHNLTTNEFNTLLHMAVDKYDLDPSRTYVEFTWWDNVYRPLTSTDCNNSKSKFILVFGEHLCNTFYKNKDGFVIPTGFYICKNAVYSEKVVHNPMTIKQIMDSSFMLQFDIIGFLFANSPINYYVDINPFKTRVYKNRGNEIILALYAEDRDSGEYAPFSAMQPSCIRMINDSIN